MPIADLMMAGVKLMLLGMGIVFAFLILLVFVLRGMSWLANLLTGHEEVVRETASTEQVIVPAAASPGSDNELLAVISAAVARFRSAQRR